MFSNLRRMVSTRTLALCAALLLPMAARADDDDDPEVLLKRTRAELAEVRHLLEQSRGAMSQLRERVATLEGAVGLTTFKPRFLTAADPGMKLGWGSATLVDSVGGPPRKVKLNAEVKGSAGTVVAFWATWCKPCTSDEEIARMRVLSAALEREGFVFVSMPIDALDAVRGDARAAKWHYPLYQATDGHLDMLPEAFVRQKGVGLPMFFVARPDGAVTFYRQGPLDDLVVAELLRAARARR